MYPIEIKEYDYKVSIFDSISDIIDFVLLIIKSFGSPKTLMIFLEKSFHF